MADEFAAQGAVLPLRPTRRVQAAIERSTGPLVWCGAAVAASLALCCLPSAGAAPWRRCEIHTDDGAMIIPVAMFYFLLFALFTVLHPGASERAPTTRCSQELSTELRYLSRDISHRWSLPRFTLHATQCTLHFARSEVSCLQFDVILQFNVMRRITTIWMHN